MTAVLRLALPLLLLTRAATAAWFVQAVEFPYRSFPPALWERELVWLKNIGVENVAVPLSATWTDTETDPLIRILRRLHMRVYLRPAPTGPTVAFLRARLATQLVEHGGPVVIGLPLPVTQISLTGPYALTKSWQAMARGATIVWTDVEDTRDASGFHRGAVSFAGDEDACTNVLRRAALLARFWSGTTLAPLARKSRAQPIAITTLQSAAGTVATALVNESETAWTGDVAAYYSPAKHWLTIPGVSVPKGDALFLPVNIPFGDAKMCRNCQPLAKTSRLVYATAELTAIEYENGILAMEFTAPNPAEVVLQLSAQPSGPYIAGAKPSEFEWDSSSQRARLRIPAGKAPGYRTRIGIAIAPPDSSAFFVDSKPLVIGQTNIIATSYSSPEIAQRSRLLLPANFKAEPINKSPLEIDYKLDVPADSVHGDHIQLVLEADGAPMGHVRLQLLRPVSMRIREAIPLHYGADRTLVSELAVVPVDAPGGRSIELIIRNNSPQIRTFKFEASGDGVDFSPAKEEVVVGGSMERSISVRVFPSTDAGPASAGLHDCAFRLSGPAEWTSRAGIAVIPRGTSIHYAADVDGDGEPEFIVENQHLRAVFTREEGGRWLEFVWKDSGRNLLPESGVELGKASVELHDTSLVIHHGNRAPGGLLSGTFGEVTLSIDSSVPGQTVYSLRRNP